MAFFSNEAKEERLNKYYDPAEIIDDQKYNMVMGGVVIEGLLVNLILCAVCKNIFETVNPIAFLVFYIICTIAGTLIARKSDNPIVSFVGYNLVVVPIGLLVSAMVNETLRRGKTPTWGCDTRNEASMRLACSTGFEVSGTHEWYTYEEV